MRENESRFLQGGERDFFRVSVGGGKRGIELIRGARTRSALFREKYRREKDRQFRRKNNRFPSFKLSDVPLGEREPLE